MGRFIEGEDRQQVSLMPECLDDYIAQDNPVRVIASLLLSFIPLGRTTADGRIRKPVDAPGS